MKPSLTLFEKLNLISIKVLFQAFYPIVWTKKCCPWSLNLFKLQAPSSSLPPDVAMQIVKDWKILHVEQLGEMEVATLVRLPWLGHCLVGVSGATLLRLPWLGHCLVGMSGATLLRLPRLLKFGDFLEFFRRLGNRDGSLCMAVLQNQSSSNQNLI